MASSHPATIKNHVEDELKKIRVKILDAKLPVWLDSSLMLTQGLDERLDNNYWSASYYSALKTLKALQDRDVVEVKRFSELHSIRITGAAPTEDGDVPLIEGTNIRPNVVYPLFEKFTSVSGDEGQPDNNVVTENDILVTKDGMPAAYCYISKILIDVLRDEFNHEKVACSSHVYRIKLKEEYSEYAPYIVQVMNSRLGQALTRRFISGSVTPTIRSEDIDNVLVPLPKQEIDAILKKAKQQIEALQSHVMEIMKNVRPSNDLTKVIYDLASLSEPSIPNLPVNWSGGGRRDLHGYYKD